MPAAPTRQPVAWPEDFLRIVEHQLALFLGPLSKVVVKSAASHASDRKHFLEFAASNIEDPSDRQKFLAQNLNLIVARAEPGSGQSLRHDDHPAKAAVPGNSRHLPPAEVDRAARLLAHYVGPLAGVLTRKAAQRAGSVRELYQLLAEHVDTKADRTRFLDDALNSRS
jgi:hypothetical protein